MEIAVIGTGFIGGVLGNALTDAGHVVRFGSRHPDDDEVTDGPDAVVVSVPEALVGADAVILALPGLAVPDLVSSHGSPPLRSAGHRCHQSDGGPGFRTAGPTCLPTCVTPGRSTR